MCFSDKVEEQKDSYLAGNPVITHTAFSGSATEKKQTKVKIDNNITHLCSSTNTIREKYLHGTDLVEISELNDAPLQNSK